MPIISIIQQPAANDLKAAYRPIVFQVNATRTDGTAIPPIVCCDIYVNGIYYKSALKTQYAILNSTNTTWQFDIMDACQEVLKSVIAANGGSAIVAAPTVMASIYCKFRSSGLNTDGFLVSEGTAPIQGTGTVIPVAGTGTQSNTFFVANSVLQHDQNQSLSAHLGFYKNGTWDANVYPLTHRPNGYKVCANDSDYFPIVNLAATDPLCIKLFYKNNGDSSYSSISKCGEAPCTTIGLPAFSFPRAVKSVPYSFSVTATGTVPATFSGFTLPTWMARGVSGLTITFTGTPSESDVGTGIPVAFTVSNPCGSVAISKTINVVETSCVAVGVSGSITLPAGRVGQPYSFSILLTGDALFTLTNKVNLAWMSIDVALASGNYYLTFTGTPTATADSYATSVDVNNCASNVYHFSGTVTIEAGNSYLDKANYSGDYGAVTGVCTLNPVFTRNSQAQTDANEAGVSVQATFHISVDNGCQVDTTVTFNPSDLTVSNVVDGTCGGGSNYCNGADSIICTNITAI